MAIVRVIVLVLDTWGRFAIRTVTNVQTIRASMMAYATIWKVRTAASAQVAILAKIVRPRRAPWTTAALVKYVLRTNASKNVQPDTPVQIATLLYAMGHNNVKLVRRVRIR